ncbi:MAG: phosphatase PAP2 family protein [Burkholderiaceae bacterium]|nr:phosphatase PAP2 family protein [Burkholderiaceae bacterium]
MKLRQLVVSVLLSVGLSSQCSAISVKQWGNISDFGAYSLLASGLLIPAFGEDWQGFREAGYSLGTSVLITQLGKTVVHKERPDHSDNNSFPSGHASLAFASATTLYLRNGWEYGAPAYALAALTGGARVGAKKHFWIDVISGAAIGTGSALIFTNAKNDKVRLLPWVEHNGGGVLVSMRW